MQSCDLQRHVHRSREAIRAFCGMTANFVKAVSPSGAAAPGVSNLFAATNMLQLLSVTEEGKPSASTKMMAGVARDFIAKRNELLLGVYGEVCALAKRADVRVVATRGLTFLRLYPDAGLRYMKDLDVGVLQGDNLESLLRLITAAGWRLVRTQVGDSPMAFRRVSCRPGPAVEELTRLFPEVVEINDGRPEIILYVEFNEQKAAPGTAFEEMGQRQAALETFRLVREEFGACEPNLKHLLDAIMATTWFDTTCCRAGVKLEGSDEVRRDILQPLGVRIEEDGCRFDPALMSRRDSSYACLADVIGRACAPTGPAPNLFESALRS